VHYLRLESDLSQAKTSEVLAVLEREEILVALARKPIREIAIRRLKEKHASACYIHDEQSVTVNSARKRGVHFGGSFLPGVSWSMSWATSDKMESMRRALLQELGHHLEGFHNATELMEQGYARINKHPITAYASTGWREYFAECFVAYFAAHDILGGYDPIGSMMVEEVLSLTRK
jgi:hypothetical protein